MNSVASQNKSVITSNKQQKTKSPGTTFKNLRQIHPVKRNVCWWQGKHSASHKLSYYPAFLSSYLKFAYSQKKEIHYLGSKLTYDNIVAPLTLMYYPHEVSEKILSNITTPIKSLLDIGGNIGQFSITFNHLSPHTSIDIFEPNPVSFKMLKTNIADKKKIKIYNYGIGPHKKQTLHFSPNQTSIASILANNSHTTTTKNLSKVAIQTVNNIHNYTKRHTYDLIKIDVEGYEYNVIKNLKGIRTRYLFLEMSGYNRDSDMSSSKVLHAIQSVFGPFNVINISSANVQSENFDVLLKFD